MPAALLSACAVALAVEPPTEPEKTRITASGTYAAWGLVQNNFLFGKDHPLDDARYVVQMLRVRVEADRSQKFGATAQVDAAQGWWGVDNSPNNQRVSTIDPATGAVLDTPTYNTDSLFSNKDTNYAVHLDTAFGWVALGPVRVQVGRQPFVLGQRLVLDEDLDGIVATVKADEHLRFDLGWAKVAEGRGALTVPNGGVMSDTYENMSDVDLILARLRTESADHKGEKIDADGFHRTELFASYYRDTIATDWTHLPSGLGYAESRYSPNVSSLFVFGASGEGKIDGKFGYKVEADVLTGRDDVDNTDFALGQLDRNDGTLFGWNAYGEGTAFLDPGIPVDVGLVAGAGSGDSDVTGGAGNVNKISTMGFFPLLNVWEDSVMPDIQGISPQGLGSPVSRGYRELENTLVTALKLGAKPVKRTRLEVVGAWLHTVSPVTGFDELGVPRGPQASDLGFEVDANGTVWFHDDVSLKLLWGWFQPGTAALYVINGNDDVRDPAWELKSEFTVKF